MELFIELNCDFRFVNTNLIADSIKSILMQVLNLIRAIIKSVENLPDLFNKNQPNACRV